jgi:hypothetical protein
MGQYTHDYKSWYYKWDMWRKGMKGPGQEQPKTYNTLYEDIYENLKAHGLDVILRYATTT